ncbi:hypothetical protein PY365_28380 [Roseiarcaceae bacterium H3SJ34-1]|uniref:hypothetical protein n=1 Tax=Terripilifer ovatus TaxID=3032367 RepID=UPI003AB91F9D|nr:hypothetical protein [Roseiarcaceae bacterium H3SJ34-1]
MERPDIMTSKQNSAVASHFALDVVKPEQFFSFDPSPFHEHSLRPRISEYLVSAAWDEPRSNRFVVDLALKGQPASAEAVAEFQKTLTSHFEYLADIEARSFRTTMREGVISLGIGLVILTVCTTLAQYVDALPFRDGVREGLRDGLSVFGWVANWRPAELLLYDWWPIRRARNLYRRLATAEVRPAAAQRPSQIPKPDDVKQRTEAKGDVR